MSLDLLDIACRQVGQARALASGYVAHYGTDALTLARMALADVTERGMKARAALYADAILILAARGCDDDIGAQTAHDVRMSINSRSKSTQRSLLRFPAFRPGKMVQMLPAW